MKFSFKNRTIRSVHKSFTSLLGCEYELNNGVKVETIEVSDLRSMEFSITDVKGGSSQLVDTTLIFNLKTVLMFGFEVTVKQDLGNGHTAEWVERICVPEYMKHRKCTIESNYPTSLIHNK